MRRILCLAVATISLATAACSSDKGDIVTVVPKGSLRGVVYLDNDGDRSLSEGDAASAGIRLDLRPINRSTVAATATSQANGVFLFQDVPVGRYAVSVDPASIPDGLEFAGIDSATVTVASGDTSAIAIGVGFPHVTIAEARDLPSGTRVVIEGVALNAWTTFGDSTLHVRDHEGAIRVLQVLPTEATTGDSVRIVGTSARLADQPVLHLATAYVLGSEPAPQPADTLSSSAAAAAAGGTLDADLVTVAEAQVMSVGISAQGDIHLLVDDGSGALDLDVDTSVPMTIDLSGGPQLYRATATGLLVPNGTGGWVLKPRSESDLILVGP